MQPILAMRAVLSWRRFSPPPQTFRRRYICVLVSPFLIPSVVPCLWLEATLLQYRPWTISRAKIKKNAKTFKALKISEKKKWNLFFFFRFALCLKVLWNVTIAFAVLMKKVDSVTCVGAKSVNKMLYLSFCKKKNNCNYCLFDFCWYFCFYWCGIY